MIDPKTVIVDERLYHIKKICFKEIRRTNPELLANKRKHLTINNCHIFFAINQYLKAYFKSIIFDMTDPDGAREITDALAAETLLKIQLVKTKQGLADSSKLEVYLTANLIVVIPESDRQSIFYYKTSLNLN